MRIDDDYNLDSDANRKRRSGQDDDLSRRRNKNLPKLDNYDRCCTYLNQLKYLL